MKKKTNFNFNLYFLGEAILDKEKKIAFSVIMLLQERSLVSKFKKFIASPYFFPDTRKLPAFFAEMEKRTGDETVKRLRLDPLVKEHYPGSPPERARHKMKLLLAGLKHDLHKFLAFEFLEDQPIELDRLKAEALRNTGQPERFSAALRKWQLRSDKLPEGRNRRFHQWQVAKLDHFNFDMDQDRRKSAFPAAWQRFHAFVHTEKLVYNNERLAYERIKEQQPLKEDDFKLSAFDELHHTILSLQQDKCQDDGLYFKAKEQFRQLAGKLSDNETLIALLVLQNCVTERHKLGKQDAKQEYLFWNQCFMDGRLETCYKGSFSRYTYLNRLQMAFFCKDTGMALDIISRYQDLLPADIRPAVKWHGEIALLFYGHNFQGVVDNLQQPPSELSGNMNLLDAIADGTRFKSFDVRSNLALFAQGRVEYDSAHAALERYRKFLAFYQKTGAGRKRAKYLKPFEKYCRQILNTLHRQRYREERNHLIEAIEKAPPFHARAWVLGYLKDLKRFPQKLIELRPGG